MPEFNTSEVQANGLRFHYLEMGEGPLARCLHGFPDSPYSYRYLLTELAEAGYRAVAPFNRGFAPTELPAERHHVHSSTMVADALALHQALGADDDAVIIAHDWGAVAAWGAVGQEPERWRRGAILNIPPFAVFGANVFSSEQITRSFYFWFFQMQQVAEEDHFRNIFFGLPQLAAAIRRCLISAWCHLPLWALISRAFSIVPK